MKKRIFFIMCALLIFFQGQSVFSQQAVEGKEQNQEADDAGEGLSEEEMAMVDYLDILEDVEFLEDLDSVGNEEIFDEL